MYVHYKVSLQIASDFNSKDKISEVINVTQI